MIENYKLEDMVKGWFIGDFEPSLFKTKDFEVGVKFYKAGDIEPEHFHKIATEFTVILQGEVKMLNKFYNRGEILKIKPGISTNFEAITDVITVVVKIPSTINDKYII